MKIAVLVLCFFLALSFVPSSSAQDLECSLCEFIVGKVEQFVGNNATEQQILKELDTACVIFGVSTWIAECKSLVNQYGPTLIQNVINDESPAVACAQVSLCNSSAVAKPVGSDVECGICTYLVSAVETYIANNATESQILSFLEHDCSLLGIANWVTICKGAVSTFGPEIIKLVLDKQPADVVCSEVGLCSNSSVTVQAPVKAVGNGTLECELCEFLVSQVEALISVNKTESEILSGLKDACAALPIKSWSSTCANVVVEYGDLIIEYLINDQPADVVCAEIQLCSKSATPLKLNKQINF